MSQRPRVTVAAVIEHNDRYLLVEERPDERTVLNQPAGHVETGERLQEAVVREVLEETARPFVPEGIVGIFRWQSPANGVTYVRICFHGRAGEQEPGRVLDPDILRTVWMAREEIAADPQRLRSPMVVQCIDDYRAGRSYPLELIRELEGEST